MDPFAADIARRAEEFARLYERPLKLRLGYGKDGSVWQTGFKSAVKVFRTPEPFINELAAYSRLLEREVSEINGFSVPQLLFADARLLVLEMTIVKPPFVLDFGSAKLDADEPTFSDEAMEYWLAERQEMFGDNWPRAAGVLSALRRLGIHMTDVHPGNIMFER